MDWGGFLVAGLFYLVFIIIPSGFLLYLGLDLHLLLWFYWVAFGVVVLGIIFFRKCNDCGARLSPTKGKCLNCGVAIKDSPRKYGWGIPILLGAVVFTIIVIFAIYKDPTPPLYVVEDHSPEAQSKRSALIDTAIEQRIFDGVRHGSEGGLTIHVGTRWGKINTRDKVLFAKAVVDYYHVKYPHGGVEDKEIFMAIFYDPRADKYVGVYLPYRADDPDRGLRLKAPSFYP